MRGLPWLLGLAAAARAVDPSQPVRGTVGPEPGSLVSGFPLRGPLQSLNISDGRIVSLGRQKSADACAAAAWGSVDPALYSWTFYGGPNATWTGACFGRTDLAYAPRAAGGGWTSGRKVLCCRDDGDCHLNGACARARCDCDAGWTGDTRGVLDLAPARPRGDNGYGAGARRHVVLGRQRAGQCVRASLDSARAPPCRRSSR